MAEFNILNESFIINTSGVGNVLQLDSEQVNDLIDGSASISLSGSTISMLIDLGVQKDVDRLDYGFTPVTTSGVTISYGRDTQNLTPGVLNVVGQSLRVFPTTSGFSFPRFFQVHHVVPSGSPVIASSLAVLNNDEDLNFGEDGTLTSFPLVGEAKAESTIYELFVRNDGVIPTDIFVSLETDGQSLETLERFFLSPTPTGIFLNFDTEIEVPAAVPWEWGFFESTTVTADNQLAITNTSNPASSLSIGNELGLSNLDASSTDGQIIEAVNIIGKSIVVSPRSDHAFNFTDVFSNTRTVTSAPSHYTISNANETEGLHPAWDGEDKIYYLNGKDTAEIQVYEISTDTHSTVISGLSFYNRKSKSMFYDNGDLIIMGARATAGSSDSFGTLCRRVKISTGAETVLQDMPATYHIFLHQFTEAPGAIYFIRGTADLSFFRYNIATNQWDILDNIPVGGFTRGLSYNAKTHKVWVMRNEDTYEFDINTGQWNPSALFQWMFSNVNTTAILFGSSTYYESGMSQNNVHKARVIGLPIELSSLPSSISGSWTSPIFRMEDADNFRRVLVGLENPSFIDVNFNNLAAPTFQVRGSDSPPSADNLIESFLVALDQDRWSVGTFGDVVITSTDSLLTFSHDENGSSFTSGFILLGLPLGTSESMQYKFWWNPSSDKLGGSTIFSALYITPFLDVIFSGKVPVRDPDTNQRTQDDYVYLKLGADGDSGGSISALEFYNGSTTSVFPVSAGSGTFYEVALTVDWTSGDYVVEFSGEEVGTGNIPGFKRNQMEPQHAVELFSAAQTVDSDEKFKFLTVSRVGLDPASEEDRAFPVHRDDPLYGKDGSLPFTATSINSPLLPKTEFLQFRFTMSTDLASPEQTPGISSLKFPPVIKLSDVAVSGSQPVYFTYEFDTANEHSSLELRLKSWMFTDKT